MGAVKRTHPESVISQKAELDFKKRLRRLGTTNQRWKVARVMLKLEKWDYKKTDFKRHYPNPIAPSRNKLMTHITHENGFVIENQNRVIRFHLCTEGMKIFDNRGKLLRHFPSFGYFKSDEK